MIERIVIIDNVDPLCFYGVNNANMQLIKNLYPKLRISARGSVIRVIGEERETSDFEAKIKELSAYAEHYNTLTEEAILDIVKGEAPKELKRDGVIIYGINGKPISARNANQQLMVDSFAKTTSPCTRPRRYGQNIHRHSPGSASPQEPRGAQNHPLAPCRGGR